MSNSLFPERAHGLTVNTVTDRDFLDYSSIKIDSSLCKMEPDSVLFSGNSKAYKRYDSSTGYRFLIIAVPKNTLPENLTIEATYNTVGFDSPTDQKLGCKVRITNIIRPINIPTTPASGRGECGVYFYNFSNSNFAIGQWGNESMDVEWEFFYSDNPSETFSLKDKLITLSSIDYRSESGRGGIHEGFILPENISSIYLSDDTCVATDGTFSNYQSYAGVLYGYKKPSSGNDNYYRQTGVSWICPSDKPQLKIVNTFTCDTGFNLSFRPITNSKPNEPIKTYKLTS